MITKQEEGLAAPEEGEFGKEPELHVCAEGEMWDEEAQACVPVTEAKPDLGPELGTSAVTESLMDAITRTIKESNAQMYKKLREEQQKDIQRLRKELSGEAEHALRKSFGLEVDPVVHKSDLANLARKMQLETAKPAKRSPASPGVAGPEGNAEANKPESSKKIDSLFKEFKEAKK